MPRIVFDEVSAVFDGRTVLEPLSLELSESRIGVIGANGGGKSTLIRMINGLGEPTTGKVTVDGVDPGTHGRDIRRRVGFVFSDAENQIIMPTVREDVAFSLRRMRLGREEREARVTAVLDRFGIGHLADASPHVLSGGEKQLLALAAVLIIDPDVIIADEPTTLLDLRNRLRIRREFDRLEQQLIVVTHDLDFLSGFDRVICVHDHRIIADGAPEDVVAVYRDLMSRDGHR
ncbi:energy-coupling factor ABC transporter ATP-binding protein [Corynebacterium pygosceleis]|uniref:ABC transporter ATP-binding protein n=1 Tax=Corynebacterium pygosceleis TaxID=2800406 RepID=A0A9Q4C6J0_9CORY|nr:ABC transporter ATP-binding protein [Corynebacterium pygosceleis]MCK7636844.1 energy-coupling factor ABC transporter ATP-binding protein [Corynebacterium pygosceleis]MCK7674318.1 energy-coupling factor ABC transporter ATP-binding protein [Corynebacterium pygosceleis]MCL0120384.1 energy-coupling factor ABC transporter ATP-binding protein [Corynebacterium pygosceleis]MCX7443930.1 ABC transporter ATP-binding protein [Corynebacterium pygosceleis]MCX7467597.1 ABC transporter ATP-binding protein 